MIHFSGLLSKKTLVKGLLYVTILFPLQQVWANEGQIDPKQSKLEKVSIYLVLRDVRRAIPRMAVNSWQEAGHFVLKSKA